MDLRDPNALLLRVAERLEADRTPYAVFGGLLTAVYGDPRETKDVDLAVLELGADRLAHLLEAGGLRTAVAFRGVRFGGLELDRVTVLGGQDATGLNTIDLVRARSRRYAEAVLARAIRAPFRGREVRIVTPEDFVVLKVLATRDRDLEDAAGVLRRTPVEVDAVQAEVDRLARELPDVEVRARWETVRARA
jgi:hypothetical protein